MVHLDPAENQLGDERYEEGTTPPIVQVLWSIKHRGYVRNGPPLPLTLPLPESPATRLQSRVTQP